MARGMLVTAAAAALMVVVAAAALAVVAVAAERTLPKTAEDGASGMCAHAEKSPLPRAAWYRGSEKPAGHAILTKCVCGARILGRAVTSAGRLDFELVHIYHHDANAVAPKAGRLDVDAARHPTRPVYHNVLHRVHHARTPRDGATTMHAPLVPDPTDQTTVLRLAEMSYDAYEVPGSPDWLPVGGYDDVRCAPPTYAPTPTQAQALTPPTPKSHPKTPP